MKICTYQELSRRLDEFWAWMSSWTWLLAAYDLIMQAYVRVGLTRKVFFTRNSQSHTNFYWHKTMKNKFKILLAKFKRESCNFILNNCSVFIQMTFYRQLTKLMIWNSITSFRLWWSLSKFRGWMVNIRTTIAVILISEK